MDGMPSLFSAAEREAFHRDGFVFKPNIVSPADAAALAAHYDALFAGKFPTGVFPDEWHWREGISLPTAVREIVNGWKTSPIVARVALSPSLGRAASELLNWSSGARIAQDDVLWKPAGAGGVGYHTDAAYISDQFAPRDDNSVTIWIALDDADEANGAVEYAVGSHRWRHLAGNATASSSSFHGSAGDVAHAAYAAAAAAGVARADVELRRVDVPRGGALFHHQDVYHGSRANTHAARPRRALAVHLLDRACRFRLSPAPDYIYGRYVLARGAANVSESFFPTVWAPRHAAAPRSDAVRDLARAGLLGDGAAEEEDVAHALEEEEARAPPDRPLVARWAGPGADGSERDALDGMLAAWRDSARHDDDDDAGRHGSASSASGEECAAKDEAA